MDAFFASVEQRDHPELRGLAVAVGGEGKRGVVSAASYEARKFGVRSAMPGSVARRLCPHLIFVRGNYEGYKEVSRQIRAIFAEYTDLIEPLSLDEAYLDVTENKLGIDSATQIANEIRAKIFERTQLTASAGVSFTKFLAKVASDVNKPNGIKVIRPQEADGFLEALPIGKFHGIGKVTAEKMRGMGIDSGRDLKQLTEIELVQRFGKAGRDYYLIVRALDNRAVNPNRIRKSIGAEETFLDDVDDKEVMRERLVPIVEKVWRYMEKRGILGRTVTLKAKTVDFQSLTRSKSFGSNIRDLVGLQYAVFELLDLHFESMGRVRLLGVTVSNLNTEELGEGVQLELF
jgi:DNA polymerase IV